MVNDEEQLQNNSQIIDLWSLFLSSVMAVGFAWATYGPDSLSEVGFVEGVITNVFTYLADTSQLRIKSVIRILCHTHTHAHFECIRSILSYFLNDVCV